MSREIHSSSVANIPFSWENKPGIRKSTADDHDQETPASTGLIINLPPPPCPPEKRVARASNFRGLQLPPPPCSAFMLPPAMIPKKGVKKKINEDEEDPFLMAYMECTKSGSMKAKGMFGFGKKKNNNIFSCKKSCSVRDDSIVRMSQLHPVSGSRRNVN